MRYFIILCVLLLSVALVDRLFAQAGPCYLPPNSTDCTATAAGPATLAWADNSKDETEFVIERNLNGSAFKEHARVKANIATYVDNSLVQGTTDNKYCYQVKAVSPQGEAKPTNQACKTILATTVVPPEPTASPAAPSSMAIKATGTGPFALSWKDNSNNETGFALEVRLGSNASPWLEEAVAPPNQTNYAGQFKNLRRHCYRARAFNSIGESGASNTSCYQPKLTTPTAAATKAAPAKTGKK
jgi:hypothetical protein